VDSTAVVRTRKLKAEGLYRRINRIYLRDLDIFYTFKDCLTSYFQYLKKTQEITQQDGLHGSLLFEIMRNVKDGKISYPHGLGEKKYYKSSTRIQDRQMINVVYDTLKNFVAAKKNEKSKEQKMFKISWDELRVYNALQVMGILSIRPEVLVDILLEWESFLNKKAELINKKKFFVVRRGKLLPY
jgi:hypothetical protein